jgi:hypothetical protein
MQLTTLMLIIFIFRNLGSSLWPLKILKESDHFVICKKNFFAVEKSSRRGEVGNNPKASSSSGISFCKLVMPIYSRLPSGSAWNTAVRKIG